MGLPVRTCRRLHADGILIGTKADDGTWEFTREALEAAAAVARNANVPSAVAPAPAVAAAIAYPAEPEPAPRQTPQIAPWLRIAAEPVVEAAPVPAPVPERVYSAPAPAHEPLGSSGEQPFWLTQGLRAEVDTRAEVESLRGQLAAARTELAQVTAALRVARIGAVAQATAIESLVGAVAAGLIPEQVPAITHALRDAASQALAQLSPEQLLHDGHAYAIARQAVHVASVHIAQQIDRGGRKRRDRDDEMRAERERRDREDHEHERQLAARAAAVTDRFREQQLAMSRRHAEEITVMREAISTVATKREREAHERTERERERARDNHNYVPELQPDQFRALLQQMQQQQEADLTSLRVEIAAARARRGGRN